MTPSLEAIQLLTERSDWVRSLARSLVTDAATADDVAQDAAIEAMRSAGSARRIGPGWLAGIVRNVAAGIGTRDRRRTRHERAAADRDGSTAVAPSAAEAAAFVEQQRLLADAVLELDTPFREVVLLRFFDGKPPREIARELAIPIATVHSRLQRGLARLRNRLDREHGGDRRAWVVALAPIAWRTPAKAGVLTLGGLWVMKKKLWAAALCAAALGLFSTWLWTGGLDGDERVEPGTLDAVAIDAAPRTVDDRPQTPAARVAVDGPSTATPIAPAGPFVRVVDGHTGEPVPEADVRAVGPELHATPGVVVDPIRRAFELGRRVAIDDQARAPAPTGMTSLFARTADRFGHFQPMQAARAGDDPPTLRLWPLQTARVLVRDARRRPAADVPVVLRVRPGGTDLTIPYSRTTTDARGVAELQWYAALLGPPPARNARIEVALGFLGGDDAFERLTEQPDGITDVTLTCPPTGSVRVRVTHHGAPAEDGTQVFLGPHREPDHELIMRHAATTRGGIATFDQVGVGIPMRAAAWLRPVSAMFDARSPGVAAAGTTAELQIDMTGRIVELKGRLVDERGEPHRELAGYGTVSFTGSPGHPIQLRTGDDGRFVRDAVIDETRANVAITLQAPPRPDVVRVPITLAPNATTHDLGDIVFANRPCLARGRVVDPDGTPVRDALVTLVVRSPAHSAGYADALPPVHTAADGRFELFGELPDAPELWLTARVHGERRHEPVAWHPGTTEEVELTMAPPVGLTGRVVVAGVDGLPFDAVSIAMWNEERGPANQNVAGWEERRVASDGSFAFGGLRPGSYTVAVKLGDGHTLATLPGVRVADAASSDSRLAPFDLTPLVTVLEITATDENGTVLDADAIAVDEHDRSWRLGSTRQPLLVPARIDAVRVGRRGSFAVDVDPTSGRHDVVLPRGIPVELRVAGLDDVPNGYVVRTRIEPADPNAKILPFPRTPNRALVDRPTGRAALRVPTLGAHAVTVSLFDTERGVEREVATETVNVTVPDAAIRLTLAPTAVRATLRAFGRR